MISEKSKIIFSKTSDRLIKIAAIIGALTVIAGAYTYYLNNLWKPTIEVVSVDFSKGVAEIKIGDKTIFIYGDATFLIDSFGDWGIRFGTSLSHASAYNKEYERLELTKKGMVVEYLKKQ